MTQGSDDDASTPRGDEDGSWDELLGDAKSGSAPKPTAPVPLNAPITVPVASDKPKAPEISVPKFGAPNTGAPGSLFAPPSLAPTDDDDAKHAEDDAAKASPEDTGDAKPEDGTAAEDEAADEAGDEAGDEEVGGDEAAGAADEQEAGHEDAADETRGGETQAETDEAAEAERVAGSADDAQPDAAPEPEPDAEQATTREDSSVFEDGEVISRPAEAPRADPVERLEEEDGNGWVYVVAVAAMALFGFFVFRSGAAAHAPAAADAGDAAESRDAGIEARTRPEDRRPELPANGKAGSNPSRGAAREVATPPATAAAAGGEATADAGGAGESESDGDPDPDPGAEANLEGEEAAPAAAADPRTVPPGTDAEAAAAFGRIPVALSDGPPVGGVGATGIHADDFAVGNEYTNRRCGGAKTAFSVGAGGKVHACFRVVHHREEEQVTVQWMKDGKLVRRNKVSVPASHAHKSRASLALREEYVGKWTVQLVSDDDVVLGKSAFTVVE